MNLLVQLEDAQEDGKRKKDAYIRIPHTIFEGATTKLDNSDKTFLGLVFSEASGFIKDKLQKLQLILEHANPDRLKLCDSDVHGYAFNSITSP
ncbi:hypothetical protein PILCRDRAFT_13805 [Piloderma croceum F 1598]|uniref:Uncharacterized protein n=1 Tax=Piloderma croceum (strain F 1598) TaxID=765440 RepID=A0A0C3ERD0_PILCF|nr:hypothetical protein PILCRDRAFT_13805 [Piloderma croceum F 1598]